MLERAERVLISNTLATSTQAANGLKQAAQQSQYANSAMKTWSLKELQTINNELQRVSLCA